MVIKKKMKIIPDKLIFDGEIHEMTKLDKSLWISGFEVYLDENRNIEKVIIDGKHPNADPSTNILCLSEEVIGKPFDSDGIPMIFSLISTYNLTYSYFKPWGKFKLLK
jgi:hypothetical protein